MFVSYCMNKMLYSLVPYFGFSSNIIEILFVSSHGAWERPIIPFSGGDGSSPLIKDHGRIFLMTHDMTIRILKVNAQTTKR